jgi:dipeptidyl-peptidase-3
VDAAPQLIADLPWPKEYEADVFIPPDFTSLEILSFATGGIPAGVRLHSLKCGPAADNGVQINIPNSLDSKP